MRAFPYKLPRKIDESFKVKIEDDLHFYGTLHTHSEIQITYINKSKGTLMAGDYIGDFGPGQLYVIGSELPHVFKNDPEYFDGEEGLKAYCISVFIHKDMFGQQFMQLPEVSDLNKFFRISGRGLAFDDDLNKIVFPFINSISQQKGLQKLITLFKILELITSHNGSHFLASSSANKTLNDAESNRLNTIYHFLLNEFKRTITLEEIAALANMTSNSFCRYFKNSTGKSFTSFLSEIRIRNASKLLHDKDLSIANACYNSGFNNLSNFNRQFKKITGMSPKDYRNRSFNKLS